MRAYEADPLNEHVSFLLSERHVVRHPVARRRMRLFVSIFLAATLCVSCRPSDTDQAEPETTRQEALSQAVVNPPEATPSDPLAIAVPDGSAEELIKFISDIAQQEPRGNTDEERNQDIARQMEARIVACERLMQKDGGAHRMLAQQTKLESLRVLTAIGIEEASKRFQDFADQLVNSAEDQMQRLGRIGQYQVKLDALIAQGPKGSMSPEETLAALKKLLAEEKLDLTLLQAANETGLLFSQVGLAEQSAAAFKLISEAFEGHEDPELAKAAQTAAEQAKMVTLGLQLRAFMRGNGQQGFDELKATIAQMSPSPQLAGSLLNVAQNLEYSGNVENAKSLYDLAAQMTSQLDGDRSEQLKEILAQAQTRLSLIGSEFSVTGMKSDGTPFAWEDYAGKVILVDFWATWCRPCIAELPNVLDNYDRFHQAGFEVVGVNLDDDPKAAREFLERRNLPWTTVISEDDAARGFQDPNCEKYGVSAIPFLVLVGRDGKVDSLHLRGPRLEQRLAELFPAEEVAVAGDEAGDFEVSVASPGGGDVDGEPASEAEETTEMLDDPTETLPPDATSATINPYQAPDDLTPSELALYLLELKDKPKSIQRRPGFCQAICDVADRLLMSSASEQQKVMAAREKLQFLHQVACLGDDECQRQLMRTVAELRQSLPLPLDSDLQFFELEQRSLSEHDDSESLIPLIEECTDYLQTAAGELNKRHLRLASNTVELINRLPPDLRDARFDRVAQALLQSNQRDVARYGKTLLVSGKAGPTVGDTLELNCTTVDGQLVDLKSFREAVVLIEFWATWCGPCRKLQPEMGRFLEKNPDVRLISICLDADQDELEEYLVENRPPGYLVFGNDAQRSAKSFGVRSIPTIFVVDQQSRLHHVARNTDRLPEVIQKLAIKNAG